MRIKQPITFISIVLLFLCFGCVNNDNTSEVTDSEKEVTAPGVAPMDIAPEMVDVNIEEGADFIITTGVNSYIYWAYYSEPAYENAAKTFVKDSYDGSFTSYEDEMIMIKQVSGTEYHIVVKPHPDFSADSCSWTLFFMPEYVTSSSHGLVDGGSIIAYERRKYN